MAAFRRTLTLLQRLAFAALYAAALAGMPGAAAQTLRYASAFDPNSLDPHSLALLYQTRIINQIYESLVNRDRNFDLEPSLATSWQMLDGTTWRFKLRPNVRLHDGTPFTADDVVFSIERVLARTSQRRFQLRGVTGARTVDALTRSLKSSFGSQRTADAFAGCHKGDGGTASTLGTQQYGAAHSPDREG